MTSLFSRLQKLNKEDVQMSDSHPAPSSSRLQYWLNRWRFRKSWPAETSAKPARHGVLLRWRHGALLDALRRSTELLDGGTTDYYREEVAYIKAVNRRLLRRYDPKGKTDRKAR